MKPVASGSSIGVSIAHTRRGAAHGALMEGRPLRRRSACWSSTSAGREIQVAILAGQALPSIEIIPKEGFYDYDNKYQPGAGRGGLPRPDPPGVGDSGWGRRP